MVTQMAKYLDTVYVSGWQSSSTASASDEPGPDLADYPYVSSFATLPCAQELLWLILSDHCAQQSRPSIHGPALP